MKPNLLKSIFISLILLVGGISKISAATVTFTADDILFFNMSAVSWWAAGTNGDGNFAYFYNNSTSKNAWSAHAVQYSGSVYYVKIPAGTWEGVILTRNNTSTAPSWNNKWNQTGDIPLSSTSNYISKFSEGSTSVTWGTQKPTSTGSLAASATSVNIGSSVTLTPSLTSNTTYNEIKSTLYSISPSSGASISSGKFTATQAGTYIVTATITYNPRGYSSLTSTATATATVTVTAPSGHNITYERGDLWTYTNNPSSAEKGALVKFDVTPNAGYSLRVTSEDVNVSNSNGNTYTFTMPDKDVTINVTAEEILTEVTINVNPAGKGTVYVDDQLFTPGGTITVGVETSHTITATPVVGYGVAAWSWDSNKLTVTGNETITLKGKGNSDKATLTANFIPLYAFIQGRFHVTNEERNGNWTNTFTNGDWNEESTNIQFDYDETTHRFYRHTYATPKELSNKISNIDPFFYIKTSIANNSLSYPKSYWSASSATLSNAGVANKKALTKTGDLKNANLKFNSTDESGYAILYFDEASVWYELEYELKYDANGGTAGTAPNRTYHSSGATATTAAANTFTNTNGTFKEWNTKQDGTGDSYGAGSTITITRNTTLYAQWLGSNPTYTITFDKQPGDGGTATVQYQNNNYNPATVGVPTRANYTFGGYYTQAEGEGVQVVSAAGEWLKSVTDYTDASGNWIKNSNVTLYAKWINNSTATEGLPTNVYLVGSFGRWDTNDDKQQFKKATADATIYTLTWTFDAAKTYEFKISVGGVIRGLDNNNEITVEKTSLVIPSTGNNCKITTTEAGEYIFTWNSKTNTLSVEYPSDKVSLTFFGDGGTVGAVADGRVLTSPAKVKPGTSVKFTATPDANNVFSQWKMNGTVVSNTATYTCTINADATVEAVFLKPTTVYLKPSNAWKSNDARFAIYYWNDKGNGWADMTLVGCPEEYYAANVPVGYSDIKFVRLNPANENHNFNEGTCWNQTANLTLPTNGNNLYDLTKIYLKPNANWKIDGARFAAYFFNDSNNEWMSMLSTNETGVYYCDVPTAHLYNKVSFVRMKGDQSTNDWNNRLNQSNDIDLFNGSNYYSLQENKWGKNEQGNNDDGMDVIYSGKWTKLEMPTITINSNANGNVVVKTVSGKTITNGEKVSLGSKVIVTMTPNNGYKVQTATINGETIATGVQYTICQNTTINVTFEIKEEWYVIGVDDDWTTPQERFRFVDGQLEVELDSNVTANFKIAHMQGTTIQNRYGRKAFSISNKSLTLTDANDPNGGDHCTIKTTYYGKYLFTWDAEQKKLTIAYPLNVGDYRLAYQDTQDNTLHVERVIKKCFTGDRLDTVSFFVRHNKQPKLVLQQCETLTNGVGAWKTINSNITFTVGKTGVWNFVLQQTNTPEHSVQVLTREDDIKPYEGDYYIRTKSAKDGWTYFRSDSHKMTYSSYADTHEPFSHYFCKWVATDAEAANKTKNVRYTIANDYGDCISDTLAADPEDANPRIVTAANGDLPTNGANVRFGWDWDTNELHRAYIAGSTNETENTFLRLDNAIELLNSNKNSVTWLKFEDLQNWIYQVEVIATKDTRLNLTALYNNHTQYFKGGPVTDGQDKRIGLLSIDASDEITFNIRLTYDFKTNHLIVAWLPEDGTPYSGKLGANMMVMRKHDFVSGKEKVAVTQLNLANKGLEEVDTVYAVMTFAKNWIQKTPVTRDQSIYWVSFPFDVKLSDAFGFGEYADAWIIQYYDGAARATNGLFSDSGTYWKYIFNPDGVVLKKGVGYVLVLDLQKIKFNHNVTNVSLYFPSSEGVKTISPELPEGITVPGHKCEIDPTIGAFNHQITDSHWNLIGVPAFKDVTTFNVNQYHFAQEDASFYYKFSLNTSKYEVVNSSNTTFQAMYSYMVQFAGTINWKLKTVTFNENQQLAARRNIESELPEKILLGLELVQGEEKADQTFVQLQQEGVTTDFDMNIDLTKIINNGANIYTLTNDRIQAAGNALPMEEVIVPVGVQIATDGEYTFRMPDGTGGMVVELIDYELETKTNLLLFDYTVTLPKGTNEGRFALHIQPSKSGVTTGIEGAYPQPLPEGKGTKFLIDGKLIIRTAEGEVFDAQGHRL